MPYGAAQGDAGASSGDDGYTPDLPLTAPLTFFNTTYTGIRVNINGALSFVKGVNSFTPSDFPLPMSTPIIAPYWADVHLTLGGDLYWRQVQS